MTPQTSARHLPVRVLAVCLGLLLAVVLTGCGGSGDASDTPKVTPEHNDRDVAFLQQMVPHHQQALMMTNLARENGAGPEVSDLAERITKAQRPEITQMNTWLATWGASPMKGSMPGMGSTGMPGMRNSESPGMGDTGEGHSARMMEGMLSMGEMAALTAARGPEFDRLFLEGMISHHEGAVEMAEREQSEGEFAPAIELAGEIVASQTAEIEEMKKLLAGE